MIRRLVCLVRGHNWHVLRSDEPDFRLTEWCCRRCGRCWAMEGDVPGERPPWMRR